jgi:hypothetical protein
MGDAPASNKTWNYHFRGQQLVYSFVENLIKHHGLNENSTIILAGTSAGARGLMTLIDILVEQYLPINSKVLGLLDSPYYIDVEPYVKNKFSFQYQEEKKFEFFSTTNIISLPCSLKYFEEKNKWKCQFGEFRIPFVKTPYFLISSQYDKYQLEYNTNTDPEEYDKPINNYVSNFGKEIQDLFNNLSHNNGKNYENNRIKHKKN